MSDTQHSTLARALAGTHEQRKRMPKQKPGRSKQDYGTDRRLIKAIAHRFGPIDWDLCAHKDNTVTHQYITLEKPEDVLTSVDHKRLLPMFCDSLEVDWHKLGGLLFCNPPFGETRKWAQKCAWEAERGAQILFLTPLTCSLWHQTYVYGKSYIMALAERLTFMGEKTPYIKDCQLAFYYSGIRGNEIWRWTNTLTKHERSTEQPK